MRLWCSYEKNISTHNAYPKCDNKGEWLRQARFRWNNVSANTDMHITGLSDSEIKSWSGKKGFYEKSEPETLDNCKKLSGKFCLFGSWWTGHYGHTLHDNLPIYEKLKKELPNDVTFLIPNYGVTKELLLLLSDEWATRIKEFKLKQNYEIDGEVFFFPMDNIGSYWHGIQHHRQAIRDTLCKQEIEVTKEQIVFCPREGDNRNGRGNSKEDQEEIIKIIEKVAKNNGGKYKIFRHKEHPTPALQKEFFKDATIILGVHGTAMTNMLWASRLCSYTQKPLQVIECVGLTDAYKDIEGFQVGNDMGYYSQFNNGMNVSWTHLFYHPINGTFENVRVDLQQIEYVLECAIRA